MNRREFLTHVGATGILTAIPAIPTMAGEWQPYTLEELDHWMRQLFSENIDHRPLYDDSQMFNLGGFGLVNGRVIGTALPHHHLNFVLGTTSIDPAESALVRVGHQYVKQTLIDNPRLIGGKAYWRSFPQLFRQWQQSHGVFKNTLRFRLTVIEA